MNLKYQNAKKLETLKVLNDENLENIKKQAISETTKMINTL